MEKENYLSLPQRMQRFVELIVETHGFRNGADIVREVDPQCRQPKQQAWRWLKKPRVIAAIRELRAKPRAAFERRYARHLAGNYNRANADRSLIVAAAMLGAEAVGLPKDPREWPQELKDCIEGVKLKDGLPEITLSDRNTASRLFAQHMGWLTELHEVTGKDGGPIEIDNARERNLALIKSVASRVTGGTAAGPASASPQPTEPRGDT